MKTVFYSTLLSAMAAMIFGIAVAMIFAMDIFIAMVQRELLLVSISMALILSAITNLCFFFIRRWDGCIEALGGLTFTAFLWLMAITPLLLYQWFLEPAQPSHLQIITIIMTIQMAIIGFITTHYQRTKNFSPQKPGEPFRW